MENSEAPQNQSADAGTRKAVKYPAKTLQYILEFSNKIYSELGHADYHPNSKIAAANKLAESSIRQTLSTAQQYGILELKHGTGYKLTQQFFRIIQPVSDNDKMLAILDCLETPDLYSDLLRIYDGHLAPQAVHLKNRLFKEYDLLDYVAASVAEIFLENLKAYGLISPANIITVRKTRGELENRHTQNMDPMADAPKISSTPKSIQDDDGNDDETMIKIPIRLKGKRMAYLTFPSEYDDQDLIRIEKVIKAYVNIYNEKDNEDI